MLTDTMKEELVKGLCEIFKSDIEAIILYGSVAKKEDTPESDIDIAIIVKKNMDDRTRERFLCWAAEMDLRYDRVFSEDVICILFFLTMKSSRSVLFIVSAKKKCNNLQQQRDVLK